MMPRYEDELYRDDEFPERPWPRRRKHSGLGIASFIIGLLAGGWEFVVVVIAGVLSASAPGGLDEKSPVAVAVGLGIIGGLLGNLVGLVLGCVSLAEKDRNKVFAIIGLAINAVVLLGVAMLMVIGLAMG